MSKLKLREIADRIRVHLQRFEADSPINDPPPARGRPYYFAGAHASGRYVYVGYISYQGASHLTREQAERYLAWLDAGNVGRHYEAFRAVTA